MQRRVTPDRFLSDVELAAFMDAVRTRRHRNQPRDHALFALLVNTGMRPSEALSLRWRDVELEGPAAVVTIVRRKKRTEPQPEAIVLGPETTAALAAHRGADAQGDAPVFRVDRRRAQRLFKTYAAAARVRPHLWLYCLRHTAATRMYVRTRSIEMVRVLLGHESADTSCIYAHIPADLMRETVRAVPPIV